MGLRSPYLDEGMSLFTFSYQNADTNCAVKLNVPAGKVWLCDMLENKLEELTGIDFFCNLPDDIEDAVENQCEKKYDPDTNKWYIDNWGITCTPPAP